MEEIGKTLESLFSIRSYSNKYRRDALIERVLALRAANNSSRPYLPGN